MRKTFPDFQQASQSGRLVVKLSQDRTQENLHFPNTQQSTPNGSSECRCFKCGEPGHFPKACLQPCQTNRQHQLTQPNQRQVSKPQQQGKEEDCSSQEGQTWFHFGG
jgi:hypothetical protein